MTTKIAGLLLLVIATAACSTPRGGDGDLRAPSASPIPGGDWATPFFGSATELTIVDHPNGPAPSSPASALRGTDLGEYLPRLAPLAWLSFHCRQTDVYAIGHALGLGGGRRIVAVFHGAPPWLDPTRPSPDGDGPSFHFTQTLAPGVRVFQADHDNETFTLFALPSSTWIIAADPMAQRIGESLSRRAVDPPLLPSAPGSVTETTGTRDQIWMENTG